jgi:flagellar motor switch/type III secretory pathway protein FliN
MRAAIRDRSSAVLRAMAETGLGVIFRLNLTSFASHPVCGDCKHSVTVSEILAQVDPPLPEIFSLPKIPFEISLKPAIAFSFTATVVKFPLSALTGQARPVRVGFSLAHRKKLAIKLRPNPLLYVALNAPDRPIPSEPDRNRQMTDPTPIGTNPAQIDRPAEPGRDVLADFQELENVKLTVVAELDRGTISMGELLNLNVGDILPFPRPIGENIDLFAADILIGNAEILAINEKLAVRVADVNRKLSSSQAQKNSLVSSSGGSAAKIRRLGANAL